MYSKIKFSENFGKVKVRYRKSGSPVYYASYVYDGTRYNAPHPFENKYRAKIWLDDIKQAILNDTYEIPDKNNMAMDNFKKNSLLFNEFAEKHLKERNIRRITREKYFSQFNLHIKPFFKGKEISKITSYDCRQWYNSQNKEQIVSLEHNVVLLKTLFFEAVKAEIIDKSPFDLENLKRRHKQTTKQTIKNSYVSDDNVEKLIELSHPKYKLMIVLGAYFGLRISEALALTKKDINLKNNTLDINKAIHFLAWQEPYIDEPKSKYSIRTIPIPEKTISFFKEHFNI